MSVLEGKVAVVTGAARGIGRNIAESLGSRGARVVLAARSTAQLPSTALPGTLDDVEAALRDSGVEVLAVRVDLSREEECARLAEETLSYFGRCDILVNNAAVSFIGGFSDVSPRRWAVAFNVNLLAPVILCQCFLPGMLERNDGRILNVGSGAAVGDAGDQETQVLQLPYASTKAGLERLTTGLSNQYVERGIGVNCLRIDGLIPTEAVNYSAPHLADQAECQPEEFAEAAASVAEQPSDFSGHVLTLSNLRSLGFLRARNSGTAARPQPRSER